MLQMTIADVLKRTVPPYDDHYLYILRDGETVFYVGRSFDPVGRLHEHIYGGRSGISYLGHLIRRCAREANLFAAPALEWQVELLTLADCKPYIDRYRPNAFTSFRVPWEQIVSPPPFSDPYWHNEAIAIAEGVLIEHYRPCLNVANNSNASPLPPQYQLTSAKNAHASELSKLFNIN